jgi:hypothetical protein
MDEYLTVPAHGDKLDATIRSFTVDQPSECAPARALAIANGDTSRAASAAWALVKGGREDLVTLQSALERGDNGQLSSTAEHVETLADRASANRLRDIAHRVAALARQGRIEEAATLMTELDSAFRSGSKAVSREFDVA